MRVGLPVFRWRVSLGRVYEVDIELKKGTHSDGKYGLYVDASFVDGTSERCDTFANETLCGDRDVDGRARFECLALEVWGVGS